MTTRTFQFYVKPSSNCEGIELQIARALSKTWKGKEVWLPFGSGKRRKKFKVIGWSSLFYGSAVPVTITKILWNEQEEGYIVLGGDWGVKIIDEKGREREGRPLVWVEDKEDLPPDVQKFLEV